MKLGLQVDQLLIVQIFMWLNDEVVKMQNEKQLIYKYDARKAVLRVNPTVAYCIDNIKSVDAVEADRIEEVKQAILQTFDNLIATHRDISNSPLANSAKYLDIPESSNDYNGIYADAMEVARRFVSAALTDLCDKDGRRE